MLIQHLYGTIIHNLAEIGFTKEAIIEKYEQAMPFQNVAFKFGDMSIETVYSGKHIRISKQSKEADWVYDVLHDALKFKTAEDFADLVLKYSEEKVQAEYEKDTRMALMQFIDTLGADDKDVILMHLMGGEVI